MLDAFEFFNPSSSDQADGSKSSARSTDEQRLASPKINIIAASTENLAAEDDLNYLESLNSTSPLATNNTGTSSSATNNTSTVTAKTITDNAADILDLGPVDSLTQWADERELHIDTSTSSESESDREGKFARDDSVDFDDIISRPSADKNNSTNIMSSDVWGGTEDSGIGVEFKATFSVSIINLPSVRKICFLKL